MKMGKPSEKDIDAAGQAMGVLNTISSGYYPSCSGDGGEDAPTFFDPDDPKHLRLFYDLMSQTLDEAPGWPTRVIGGMCYVVLFDENQIVDPDADCLELHPRFAAVAKELEELKRLVAEDPPPPSRHCGCDACAPSFEPTPSGREP
jgi:hypothetical protein